MLPIYYEKKGFKTQCKIIVKILNRFSYFINVNFTFLRTFKNSNVIANQPLAPICHFFFNWYSI